MKIDPNLIDLNRDGVINLDEIKRYLANHAKGGNPEDVSGKIFTSYSTTYEHLPEGVPSWYLERDTDHDGQLTLLEYANGQTITEALVGEFEFLDLNNDGIITVEECYQAIKAKEEAELKAKEEEKKAKSAGQSPSREEGRSRGGRDGNRNRGDRSERRDRERNSDQPAPK